jgi:recombination protein RecA
MPRPALDLGKFGNVVRAASLLDQEGQDSADQRAANKQGSWSPQQLAGRLVELSGSRASAALTLAMGLVYQAQRDGEPAAWVSAGDATFFPPDAARGGIDLQALPVVQVRDGHQAARAADKLARSGAFGLVVLDLNEQPAVPTALMRRLMKWAEEHQTALLCLTDRPDDAPSLSPLVSLRGVARRSRVGEDRFSCRVEIVRDKRRGPGWSFEEVCCGPPGLR